MNLTTPYQVAFFRAGWEGFLYAGAAFFASPYLPDSDIGWAGRFYAAGAAFFAHLLIRGAYEGTKDHRSGAQRASDTHRAVEDTDEPHVIHDVP